MKVIIGGYPIQKYITNLTKMYVEYEEENPDFRCMCNRIHVFPLTKVLFLFSIGQWLLFLGCTFPWSLLLLWIPVTYFVVTTYALKKHSRLWMWPAIIHFVALFLCSVGLVVVIFSTAIFSTQTVLDTFGQGHVRGWFARLMIVIAIKAAALIVSGFLFYNCYIFNLCRKYFFNIEEIDLELDREEATELRIIDDKR